MADMKVEIVETQGSQPTPEAQKPVVEVKKTEEPKYVRLEDLDKINQALNNTREYNNRKLQEINEKLERLIPKAPEQKPDDLDELVQKDWKAGVTEVTRRVLSEERNRVATQTESQRVSQILEESKRKVMEKHKELEDVNHPKTREFMKVIEENPDYKDNPRGPILAMYEMENRLKAHGNIEVGDKPVPQPVKEARARASSVPAGTSAGTRTAYSLSKADLDFCRLNNINPENYKRFKGQTEARG